MYDTPHLINNIRINIFQNVLVVDGINVRGTLVEELYAHDVPRDVRMCLPLTRKHIDLPTIALMSAPLAAQVMSHSVDVGINY